MMMMINIRAPKTGKVIDGDACQRRGSIIRGRLLSHESMYVSVL